MKNSTSNGAVAELESPFLHLTNFKQSKPIANLQNTIPIHSPFKSVYELEGIEQGYDTKHETLVELMNELYDKEFDGMLRELAIEGQEFIENELPSSAIQNESVIKDKLNQHFAPLLNEFDKFINHTINAVEQKGEDQISEDEFESLVDNYILESNSTPVVEHFLKKLKKKFKKAVKKGVRFAKKGVKYLGNVALKHIMKIFKKIFPLLIKLAYKMGLFKKIPKKYRFVTDKILKKIGVDPKKAYSESELQFEQQEFDAYIANILMAPSQEEFELIDNEFDGIFQDEVILDYNALELENSRIQFVNELKNLNEEESTKPPIDEFVSAIILASKLLGGRKKAISFMGKHLGSFFSKWIGANKKDTVKFAKHLIDKGLNKFGFEVAPESELEPAFEAMVTVIERTTQQIAELPEISFENETLLANHIVHSFELAASAYLPDILQEEQYEKRPDLREALTKKLAWKIKKRGKRKRYCKFKKLNREIDIELTPYIANEVKTFEGNSLKKVLQDQFGYDINNSTPATIHLYETMPGGNLQEIINNDAVFNKHASLHPSILSKQLFPLTSVASGLLLGEPSLGCKCKSKCLNRNTNRHGRHRYYYLEIPGAFPQVYTSKEGIQSLRNTTSLKVKLNFIKNVINLSLFLSETDAQKIASEIRQSRKENASILINAFLSSGLNTAFSKHTSQNISIVHPKVIPGKTSGESFKFIPRIIQENLRDKLASWTNASLSAYTLNNSEQFVRAVDDSLDGVSIEISMQAPDGFKMLKDLIGFHKVQLSETIFLEKKLEMTITVKAGNNNV